MKMHRATLGYAFRLSYTWDFENRLKQATLPGGATVSFKYDPFGRRIYKSSTAGTTIYLPDGANIVEERNGSGAIQARYTHSLGIDEPLAMLRGSTTSYYHADGLGSVTSLTNSSGTAVNSYIYDSYGRKWATFTTEAVANPFQYTGREWDAETGLYYYRARYYEPKVGRFLSADPIRFLGGNNFYSYVLNNPINWIDPTGLKPGDKYDTAQVAALQALIDILPQSLREGVEYAGRIYRTRDGKFSYTKPRKGGNDPRPWSNPGSCPWFTKPAGNYHTHPNIRGYDSENFSKEDMLKDNLNDDTGFLGTGSGVVLMHEPYKDVVEIGRIPTTGSK